MHCNVKLHYITLARLHVDAWLCESELESEGMRLMNHESQYYHKISYFLVHLRTFS